MSKHLGTLLAELCKEHTDANRRLVFQQADALQEQYRRENGIYRTEKELLRQETFAYLILKGNLDKGLYRQ